VVLTDRQRAELERIARRAKAALWRGRWLEAEETLTAAEGEEDPKALTEAIRAVLSDAPRSGGPPKFSPEQLCAILAIACEPPEESGHPVSHWTPDILAAEASKRGIVESISSRHVGRFLNGGPTSAAS
jgi:putative transposase